MATLNNFGLKDLKGQLFGSLRVLFKVNGRKAGKISWRCQCVCGARLTVRHDYLIHKNSPKRHCGCLNKKEPSFISQHRDIYGIWKMMLTRCENPDHATYVSYGARGISVCDNWHDFDQFVRDIGPRPDKNHSLDRINPDGNYEPSNVRWASATTQARNKRRSLFLDHPETGKKVPAAEVAEYFGISYQQLRYKYQKEGKWPT